MIPVISFIGRSETGKTTLLEKVIAELAYRGWRVGVLKHAPEGFDMDHPGKDSARFAEVGAAAVAVASPGRFAFMARAEPEPSLEQMSSLFEGRADVLITEGYKNSRTPKILVVREQDERGVPPFKGDLLGTFSPHTSPAGVPVFSTGDILAVAVLVERQIEMGYRPPALPLASAIDA